MNQKALDERKGYRKLLRKKYHINNKLKENCPHWFKEIGIVYHPVKKDSYYFREEIKLYKCIVCGITPEEVKKSIINKIS